MSAFLIYSIILSVVVSDASLQSIEVVFASGCLFFDQTNAVNDFDSLSTFTETGSVYSYGDICFKIWFSSYSATYKIGVSSVSIFGVTEIVYVPFSFFVMFDE